MNRVTTLVVAVAGLSACQQNAMPFSAPEFEAGCVSWVEMSVELTDNPVFSWTPSCPVNRLNVYHCSNGVCPSKLLENGQEWGGVSAAQLWGIVSVVDNGLFPGIEYGQVLEGVHTSAGPQPLMADSTYVVSLATYHGFGEPIPLVGGLVFTMPGN